MCKRKRRKKTKENQLQGMNDRREKYEKRNYDKSSDFRNVQNI